MNDLEDEEIVLRVEKDPLIGKLLAGRFRILSILGRGGMGVVYKAHQEDIERDVAIKTLHLVKGLDPTVIQKFRQEAQAVARVKHPNTVTLYDFGVSEEGVPFLVMDLLSGSSFRDILKQNAPLRNLGRVNHVFQQVCSALSAAHNNGIVHKDLKPENIMICNRPGQAHWVYVLDFGIADMMGEGEGSAQSKEIIGSPPYMSPEQCLREAKIDRRSDIYSLGVCLFEALSGKFPFQAKTAMEMIECHKNASPKILKDEGPLFGQYESLTQLICKAMEKRPEKRQQTVDEFASELEDAIKKDSKRGLQLKDRMTLELVAAVDVAQFVDIKDEAVPKVDENKKKSLVEKVQALVLREEEEKAEAQMQAQAQTDKKDYHFHNCPHCDAPTEEGIKLCLACGRSLAATEDFSKIRAARGEFSLPKQKDLSTTSGAHAPVGFSQRSRVAMLNSGNFWTRPQVLIGLVVLTAIVVFLISNLESFLGANSGTGSGTSTGSGSGSGSGSGADANSGSTGAKEASTTGSAN